MVRLVPSYAVARKHIPERLDEFALAMERSLGCTPSKTIERIIAKKLSSKLGLAWVEKINWRLPDYVREARAKVSRLLVYRLCK